jgi:hypothetical protein
VANVTAVAKDSGGTANGGHDTSAPCTFAINVNGVNDAPTAAGGAFSVRNCEPLRITLGASDPDSAGSCGSPLVGMTILTQPAHGTLAPGSTAFEVIYTAAANYIGPDSFTYAATDGVLTSAPATVALTVGACIANTAPTAKMQLSPLGDFSPQVLNKLAISCNGSNVCLSADGSQSSDQETPNSQLTFTWLINGVAVASGQQTTLCLELGTYTVMLVVTDPQGASGTDSQVIEVVTASEAIDELIGDVNESSIDRKNKRPFLASLKSAAAAADRGQINAAQNVLHAFQNKVRAQVSKNNPTDAARWIRKAQAIIDGLEGCAPPE